MEMLLCKEVNIGKIKKVMQKNKEGRKGKIFLKKGRKKGRERKRVKLSRWVTGPWKR